MTAPLARLTLFCESAFSLRIMKTSLTGLGAITCGGFVLGSFLFHTVLAPYEPLHGRVMGDITIKQKIVEPPITATPTPPDTATPTPPDATTTLPPDTLPTPDGVQHDAAPTEKPPEAVPVADAEVGLYEVTPYGSLPIVRQRDQMTVFQSYQTKFSPKHTTTGIIALGMVDFGLSEALSKTSVLTLPANVSFVASPYAATLQPKITGARSYGHEVWMEVPMQTSKFGVDDSGPATLLTGLKNEQNERRLKATLGKATGYAGIAILNEPSFAATPDSLDYIFQVFAARGLGYVGAFNADATRIAAENLKIPHVQSPVWIDASLDKDDIAAVFKQLEDTAQKTHVAVAFFHPSAGMFAIIKEWQKSLESRNMELAPLSAATTTIGAHE